MTCRRCGAPVGGRLCLDCELAEQHERLPTCSECGCKTLADPCRVCRGRAAE